MTWPDKIRMSGLPLHLIFLEYSLWGWNTTYTHTLEVSEEAPTYRFFDYWLGPIHICGCTIRKHKGRWVLFRNSDHADKFLLAKDGPDQDSPIGSWTTTDSVLLESKGTVYDLKSSWVYGWM